jgi:aspartate dehydrogenase
MTAERIALIGFGAIGQAVALGLAAGMGEVQLAGLLVREYQRDEARRRLPESVEVVTSLQDLLAFRPSLVVECAGQDAVRDYAASVLGSGTDLMIASTGALELRTASRIRGVLV